ncbi:MAG TPA: aldo/keto reductase [Rhizomicrobium sp.]|nr:aldo/keto reductase [Rhizomicrobium sp.]
MALKLDEYRLLGRSGLRVSPICFGTMTFGAGDWGSTNEEAKQMVDVYIDRGGNFFDTANIYGQMGQSEIVLGEAIHALRRDSLVIATKYSLSMFPNDPNAAGNHRKNMVRAIENSLKRLKTEYIDLYYLHVWDSRTPVDEILRAFDDLVRAGKVIYIGLSDTPAWQASRMQAIAELRGWSQFCALQIAYSLMERTVEHELIPMAAELGMGVCPWSPLGGGILTGKYSKSDLARPGGSLSSISDIKSRKDANIMMGQVTEKALAVAEVVSAIAKETGKTAAQIAVAWTLVNRAVTAPIIGVRTVAQLKDNLGALDVELDAEQLKRLDAVSSVPPVFPKQMLSGPMSAALFGTAKVEERR